MGEASTAPDARVLIDAERLRQPNSGLGQVALRLGREFLERSPGTWSPVFLLPRKQLGIFGRPVPHEAVSWRRRHLPASCPDYDLWHVLHQDARYLPNARTPYVLTIHDLNFLGEKSPRKARRRLNRVQRLVDGASAITVISHFVEGVVRENLDLGGKSVEVIHNGLCSDPEQPGARPGFLPNSPYLFALGVVRRKKNFHVLVDMLYRLDGIHLVIAGNASGPYAQEIRKRADALGIGERVLIPGEVTTSEKNWLMQHCEAFVYPSRYEGFGLPILEAMSCGRPTFCSAMTSLPEVGGPDVFYWERFDPDYMAEVYRRGMQDIAADPGRLERLRARAAMFSWRAAADRYAQLYERVLASG